MAKVTQFEDLTVWWKAEDFAVAIYRITAAGGFAVDLALRDRIRRAAVSVMSNIAEGFERYSRTEFRHFLSIARGSAAEARSQLQLARRLGYITQSEFSELYEQAVQISRMLPALRASMDST